MKFHASFMRFLAGLHGCKARRKPHLTVTHRRAHWCLLMSTKIEQWSKVVFSDESKFLPFRSDSQAYLKTICRRRVLEWAPPGDNETWRGWNHGMRVYQLTWMLGIFEGRLSAAAYIELLKNSSIPSTHSLCMPQSPIGQCHLSLCPVVWRCGVRRRELRSCIGLLNLLIPLEPDSN